MNKNKKINLWWVAIVSVVGIILFFGSREEKPLVGIGQRIVRPFAHFFSNTGFWFEDKFSFWVNIGEMKRENERLFNENLELKFKVTQLKETESENAVLREEIDLMSKSEFKTVASLIIGKTLSKDRKIIYLDKGEKNEIKEGQPVIVGGGILVGKISKVYTTTAEVELILDKNNKINVEIQETGVKGIVQGEYGTSAVMDMIPQSAELNIGQTVITSGLGGVFPRGLLIGHTKEIGKSVDQLFQKTSLELPVQFQDLRLVWVVLD